MTAKKNDGQEGADARAVPYFGVQPGLTVTTRHRTSVEAAIGETMRAMYDDLLQQPIPDRLVDLLTQIDRARESKAQ